MKRLKTTARLLKAVIALQYAKLKAQQRRAVKGKRQYILMGEDNKLLVLDQDSYYKLLKRNILPRSITLRKLPRLSVWYTSGITNGKRIPQMRKRIAQMRKRRYLEYIIK